MSAAKIGAFVYGAFGILAGFFMLMATMGAGAVSRQSFGPLAFGGVFGALFIPVLYALLGFIGGVISAAVYNFAAKYVGGIKLETSK